MNRKGDPVSVLESTVPQKSIFMSGLETSRQSYKQFTIVIYKSRVVDRLFFSQYDRRVLNYDFRSVITLPTDCVMLVFEFVK